MGEPGVEGGKGETTGQDQTKGGEAWPRGHGVGRGREQGESGGSRDGERVAGEFHE